MSADTAIMPIPGPVDPVPVPRAPSPRADGRVELVGLGKEQIGAELEAAGLAARQAKLRGKQIWHWIYNRGVSDFTAMSDIAKPQRGWFAERFTMSRPEVVEAQVSSDGTRKWLLKTHDGHDFEMVFIPDADRGTLCVSSQVGCTLNCRFCATGTMQLVRNLEPSEIVGQVMLARDALGEWPSQPEGRMLTNIVMMGMGEPLYNFEYVMLKDKNDSDEDARELVRLIRKYKLPAKVNLIPFNPWPGAPYECSTGERIRAFSDIVFEAGISAPVRTPRGRDIDAACGQLKTAAERKRKAREARPA